MTIATSAGANTGDLMSPDFWHPHQWRSRVVELQRKRTPVFWHPESAPEWNPSGWRGFWAVTRSAEVRIVLRESDIFANLDASNMSAERAGALEGMLHIDGPEHRAHRKTVVKSSMTAFTPAAMKQTKHLVREHARRAVAGLAGQTGQDIVAELAIYYPVETLCDVLGLPPRDNRQLVEIFRRQRKVYFTSYGNDAAYEMLGEWRAFFAPLIERRLDEPDDGPVSALVHGSADSYHLSPRQITAHISDMLGGALEDISNMVGNGMVELASRPQETALWRANMPAMTDTAVEELLRWITPVRYTRRTARYDTVLGGQQVRAGDTVLGFLASANFDEEIFDNPLRLDLTRSPSDHFSFSGGAHQCMGRHLGRFVVASIFEELLTQLADFELDGEPMWDDFTQVNSIASAPFRFRVRESSAEL